MLDVVGSHWVRLLPALAAAMVPSACGDSETTAGLDHDTVLARDPDVPELPFDDNLDPSTCGIPVAWGLDDPAWLTGEWDGELVQPDVLLYDSHARVSITGQAPHGAEVRIVMYQENPVLDYYLVETPDGTTSGWVPAPFVSFEVVR